MLTDKQLVNICLKDDTSGKRCRYICMNEHGEYHCGKLHPKYKDEINDRLSDLLKKNPKATNIPQGDNCPGFLILGKTLQGIK